LLLSCILDRASRVPRPWITGMIRVDLRSSAVPV
jgi:hypothetical protein